MTEPVVDILLATYDGARFLGAQLASLDKQDFDNWRLLVRDDGSTDETLAIIGSWAQQTGRRVEVYENKGGAKGSAANFSALLQISNAPYFCFCDQDDVWMTDKISTLLAAVRDAEASAGSDTPILAHSDLEVVGETLEPLHKSFWQMLKIQPQIVNDGNPLLFQNHVTGCAMLGNARLREVMGQVPPKDVHHDWWAALVARYLGQIAIVPRPTLLYRQHQSNVVGATKWGAVSLLGRLLQAPQNTLKQARDVCRRAKIRAYEFHRRFESDLPPDARDMFAELAALDERNFWGRKSFMRRHKAGTGYWLRDKAVSWLL